ncbi:MAG TPA: TetR family transcriptional regulator, partial [Acidimicrobiales bacterium]
MAIRPKTHRASGQLRRSALLKAAADLAGEVGVGAVTHRAVAARAGVPLSTTSYFFASIEELMIEAMREAVNARVAELEDAILGVADFEGSPLELAHLVAAALVAAPHTMDMAEVEVYLAGGRYESLRETLAEAMDAFVRFAEAALAAAGARHPEQMAPIFRAY